MADIHTSGATAPAPTIRNPRTTPTTPRKLFVNIPVQDVQRSIDFFQALGFDFNAQFTDATAAAMLVGEDAYFMLLQRDRFATFTNRPVGDPTTNATGIYALGVDSRDAVDAMVHAAIANGGAHAMPSQDHGFMYGWSFHDPDGHHFEVFWMNPSVVQG